MAKIETQSNNGHLVIQRYGVLNPDVRFALSRRSGSAPSNGHRPNELTGLATIASGSEIPTSDNLPTYVHTRHSRALERYVLTVEESIANKVIDVTFNRGNVGNAKPGSDTIEVYDKYGTVRPIDGDLVERARREVFLLIREKTAHLSEKEKACMGKLLPDIVAALMLNSRFVSQIYEGDVTTAAAIAVEWFVRPDAIEETHFREGFGGEEVVSARGPAYMRSIFASMEAIQDKYTKYTNWALENGLYDRVDDQRAEEVTAWRTRRMNDLAAEQTDTPSVVRERQVLDEAWVEFVGHQPDMVALQDEYHFRESKKPKIVVFNASHAAIEITGMDRTKTIETRDKTQELLRGYTQEFHPEVADALYFQNDRPWTEHNLYTRLFMRYAYDRIRSFDGRRTEVAERLAQFGQNHLREVQEDITGMEGLERSELYGALHFEFFQDPQKVATWHQLLEKTLVMEDISADSGYPQFVVIRQGAPEKPFGAYRKLFAEDQETTVDGFVSWIQRRHESTVGNYDELAVSVLETARVLAHESTTLRPFESYLGQAINIVCKKPEKRKRSEKQKGEKEPVDEFQKPRGEFITFMGSALFKEATDKEAAWIAYQTELSRAKLAEGSDEVAALLDDLQTRQQRIVGFHQNVNHAIQYGDQGTQIHLMQTPEADHVFGQPERRLEQVVPEGVIPVYYPLEGSDCVVWPTFEQPSLAKYDVAVNNAQNRNEVLREIAKYASKVSTRSAENVSFWQLPFWNVDSRYSREQQEVWADSDRSVLQDLYETALRMKQAKVSDIEIGAFLDSAIQDLHRRRGAELASVADVPVQVAEAYVLQVFGPQRVAEVNAQYLSDSAITVRKANVVRNDYIALLDDIDPNDREMAEERYNAFLARLFQPQAPDPIVQTVYLAA